MRMRTRRGLVIGPVPGVDLLLLSTDGRAGPNLELQVVTFMPAMVVATSLLLRWRGGQSCSVLRFLRITRVVELLLSD